MTHVCDYCAAKYELQSDDDMVACDSCGEQRLYNLKENRVSVHYLKVGAQAEFVSIIEEEEELPKKKTKKKSKDIKTKRVPLSHAEKVMQRYNYRAGGS